MADSTSRYLSKGGVVLGIAAFSQSRNIDCGSALGPALFQPATELLKETDTADDVVELANAVRVATTQRVPVAMSSSIKRCATETALRMFVGDNLCHDWPPGTDVAAPSGTEGGLIALALAVCRNADLILAVSAILEPDVQERFRDMANVAAVLVAPGKPSQLRRQLKSLVSAYDAKNGNDGEAPNGSSD